MKIYDVGGKGGPQPAERAGKSAPIRQPASPGSTGADRIEISDAALRISRLLEAASALPEIREEKIAELRQALESGTYRVDPRALARAILELEDGLSH